MMKKEATNQPHVMGNKPKYPKLNQMVPVELSVITSSLRRQC